MRVVASALQAAKPGLGDREAYMTVYDSLNGMKTRGMVGREGKA